MVGDPCPMHAAFPHHFGSDGCPGPSCVLRTSCYYDYGLFVFLIRLTFIPGLPFFSLTVQLFDPFPCRAGFIKDIQ